MKELHPAIHRPYPVGSITASEGAAARACAITGGQGAPEAGTKVGVDHTLELCPPAIALLLQSRQLPLHVVLAARSPHCDVDRRGVGEAAGHLRAPNLCLHLVGRADQRPMVPPSSGCASAAGQCVKADGWRVVPR